MDKKLTDNEIIKDLKEILELMCCEGDLQRSATISHAIDLINRLQARVEKCEKVEYFADKTIATLQAENERLREECGNQSTLWSKHFEGIFETAKETIKSEARKEFAEKICFEANKQINWHREGLSQTRRQGKSIENDKYIERCEGAIYAICYIRDCVHNLLMEMESENNG